MQINLKHKHHPEWQLSRLNFLKETLGIEFFKNKTLLELGSYNGSIGNVFSQWGSIVTCLEGRQENVDEINKEFPHLNAKVFNSDTPDWPLGEFDLIVNWGLFYHLENYHKENLINCINHSSILFFETCVYDRNVSELIDNDESGATQSLTNKAKIPTSMWIEDVLRSENVSFEKVLDPRLNGGGHHYSWTDGQYGNYYNGLSRRFYIVEGKL
jgi:hypothetical protein